MKLRGISFAPVLALSAALHVAFAAILSQVAVEPENDTRRPELLLHLSTPPETPKPPMLIMAALPETAPPPEVTPTPPVPTPPTIDDATMRELAEERTRLREELRRARSPESLPPPPEAPQPAQADNPAPQSPPRSGDLSTIRELNFEGYPDDAVALVMARYRMQVKMKVVQGGSNQSFLSSASSNRGDTFLADRNSPPGLYQVFELSRDAVNKMSSLEEQAIRSRGMDPERTHVKRIRFGVVQSDGGYDLGVVELEAEPV